MSKRMRTSGVLLWVLLTAAVPVLQGCIAVAAAGIAGGTLASMDRRTVGTQVEDRSIQLKIANRLNAFGDEVHFNATVYNRRVLLTGEVPDVATKDAIGREVAKVENVQAVFNELSVQAKSSLSSRSNDALISGKVKATLIDAKDVYGNVFKITTERGVVYLMGLVTESEAQRAAKLAATVNDVVKVVKIIEPISEAEYQRLNKTPAPEAESVRKPF